MRCVCVSWQLAIQLVVLFRQRLDLERLRRAHGRHGLAEDLLECRRVVSHRNEGIVVTATTAAAVRIRRRCARRDAAGRRRLGGCGGTRTTTTAAATAATAVPTWRAQIPHGALETAVLRHFQTAHGTARVV